MNYHGLGVKKQCISSSQLLAILVALVTIFILGEFSEKHIFVHIRSFSNSRITKFSGMIYV